MKTTTMKTTTAKTTKTKLLRLTFVFDIEADGRCIAEVTELPGVMSYGKDIDEAFHRARALAKKVIAERMRFGEN